MTMHEAQTDPLTLVLSGLSTPVFVIDHTGSPYYANRAALDLLGKGIDPSAKPGDLAEVYQAKIAGTDQPYPTQRMPIVRALAGEATSVDDMVIDRPDGRVHIEVDASPIFGADGRVAYAAACFRDVTRERQLERDMYYDKVTGALNRYALERDLAAAILRLERSQGLLGVVFMDLNRFKPINDEHGHHVGDRLLHDFTRRLRSVCRSHEQPYRYGGDEFVLICESLEDESSVEGIRSRVQRSVEGEYVIGDLRLDISAAVGTSSTRSSTTSPAQLLMEADARMYQEKTTGAGWSRLNRDLTP